MATGIVRGVLTSSTMVIGRADALSGNWMLVVT